ncbi:chaperonin 10-like protein [Dactylonectria estremocensis]|uniref:D-xylulose reductase n=1 Tax=Dactylonectria estremocensis TaxID=1079267 RepID=A0A9P9I8Y5_9HYPO|nr:chaperonin 10-like protein [Dactylonectria estremocensis]
MASNLSFVLNKLGDVSFEERPKPALKNPHDVLVAINYTGICGSDVHYWVHGAIGKFVVKDPMVLGHESAGTVVEVGEGVTTLRAGDRVALEPGYPCRRCTNCTAGRYNLCPDMVFAATPPYDGTLTGYWVAPADFCFKLPDNVSQQEGALIEPLAVAVHIVKQANVKPGHSVVVMGDGPVGLLCAAVAKAYGATSKLDFAKEFASTHAYSSQRIAPEENAKALLELAEPSIQTSIHVVKVGGSYVHGGMGKSDITFPIMAMCIKEMTMSGSFRYGPGDYPLAVELLASGKVDVKKLITGVVEFKQARRPSRRSRKARPSRC